MNWIRIAVAIGDDPDIHELADALNVRVAEAVGLVVGTLVRFPEHAPDGNLAHLRDSLIERWAGWEGDRGRFAAELRRIFLTDGVWSSWEKHNGAAMREAEASRERARKWRTERLENDARTAYATPNGTPDRTPLRTDGRTNQTTGSRKRGFPQPEPFKTDPFCPECGQGMGKANPDDTRLTLLHTPECSRATQTLRSHQ